MTIPEFRGSSREWGKALRLLEIRSVIKSHSPMRWLYYGDMPSGDQLNELGRVWNGLTDEERGILYINMR